MAQSLTQSLERSLPHENQNGFALVGFVTLAPLILTIFAVIAAAYLILQSDAKARHSCRTELLESQQKVADKLNSLIKMNPEAAELRGEKEAADEFVRQSAPYPPQEAIAEINLARVVVKQTLFAIKQKALIAAGNLESRVGPLRASRSVSQVLNGDQQIYHERNSSAIETHSTTASFSLDSTPSNSETPDYNPSSDFQNAQTMTVKWTVRLLPFLPEWFNQTLHFDSLKVIASCSATLTQEGGTKWSPKLSPENKSGQIGGKLLSKFF